LYEWIVSHGQQWQKVAPLIPVITKLKGKHAASSKKKLTTKHVTQKKKKGES
jgi:hypothetical protein